MALSLFEFAQIAERHKIMNFCTFIYLCAVVSQMAQHAFAKSYRKCHKIKNGAGCIGWSKNAICKLDGCKYSCWPDYFSCCGCGRKKSCFPSASKVNLDSGKSVTMSELQLGDRVKIGKKVYFNLNFTQGLKK